MTNLIFCSFFMLVCFSNALSACNPSLLCGWEIYGGAVGLFRSRPHHQALFTTNPNTRTLLDAHEYDFDMTPGYDLRVKKDLGKIYLDARYLEVKDWNDHVDGYSLSGPFLFQTSQVLIGANGTNTTSSYTSRFHNWEINAGTSFTGIPLSLFVGYRQGNINEHSTIDFTQGATPTFIENRTKNCLWGPQIGAAFTSVPLLWRLQLEGFLKGWFYTGKARSAFHVMQDNTSFIALGRKQSLGVGIDGLLGIKAWIYKSVFAHIGYEALWLNKVALAIDQYQVTDPLPPGLSINIVKKEILYHGVLGGISIKW